jgi:hypothetical protein
MRSLRPLRSLARTYASASKARFVVPARQLIKEQAEYRQLPDDSQYIEKFYNELSAFDREIKDNTEIPQTSFSEFEEDPNALVATLEQFIQNKVLKPYSGRADLGSRAVIQRYGEFLTSVKTTLVLNGGHPFIFDVLLQNKQLFDGFDKGRG